MLRSRATKGSFHVVSLTADTGRKGESKTDWLQMELALWYKFRRSPGHIGWRIRVSFTPSQAFLSALNRFYGIPSSYWLLQ
eukprot:4364113-Pleurochrysis_carterae.AAC.8